jgi:RNA polymerase sigma-70 factor, ECF subfamily
MEFTSRDMKRKPMEEERFESLYRAHYDNVLAYVLRRASADIGDDIVTETFVVAWRRRAVMPEEPLPWFLGIARRVLANERRATQRRDAFLDRHAADLVGPITVEPTTEPGAGDILAAFKRLRESDRELLLLIAWEGLTPGEAARVMGESPLTCRVRLHRARRQFARRLTEVGQVDDAGQKFTTPRLPLNPRQEQS